MTLMITWDEANESLRVSRHESIVATIMNPMLRQGGLVSSGDDATPWTWGYVPANAADWSGTPPTTVGQAIDRIAFLVKALGQSP